MYFSELDLLADDMFLAELKGVKELFSILRRF